MKSDPIVAQDQDYCWNEDAEMQVNSFVIRIWTQPKASKPEVRGWVEHVQSGKRTAFHGWMRMLAIIAAQLHLPSPAPNSRQSLMKYWRSYLADYFTRRRKDKTDHDLI